MNHLFLITSAIKTKFGMFEEQKRIDQTFQTIESIRKRVPNAKIVIVESSALPVEEELLEQFREHVTFIVNMSGDKILKHIFDNTENWDIAKNMSELLAFNSALPMLEEQTKIFEDVDRIHKLSGRYTLNDNFNLNIYERFPDKIILPMRYKSQFTDALDNTNIPFQYMSRLWSWPKSLHEEIKDFYKKASDEFVERLKQKSRVDMEHLLFLLLPPEHIREIPIVGVKGRLGQNGRHVEN